MQKLFFQYCKTQIYVDRYLQKICWVDFRQTTKKYQGLNSLLFRVRVIQNTY